MATKTVSAAPLRVANLLGRREPGHGFDVPASAVGSGFESEVVYTRIATTFINDLDRSFMDMTYAEAGLRAEASGFDAVVINTFGDYGLRPLRASLSIPAFGAGQSAMQLAAGLGERFGILTVWPTATRRMYERLVTDYGFSSRCTEVRHVIRNEDLVAAKEADGLVARMRSGRSDVLDQLEREARQMLDAGAEVIVLGCTCMSPAQPKLAARLGCPVVDPLSAAHKLAEVSLALGLKTASPMTTAINTHLIQEMVNAVADIAAARPVMPEACGETCAIVGEPSAVTITSS